MQLHKAHWGRTLFWGAAAGLLYVLMFSYAGEILHFMHTTPDACVITQGDQTTYLHHPDPALCAAKGGEVHAGHWYLALVPILIALLISWAHGTFTGLFWDSMGLKAAQDTNDKH